MYKSYQKENAVRAVQQYLIPISKSKYSLTPNGKYDEKTKVAVEDFQKRMNLSPTGSVDKKTFDLLYKEYINAKQNDGLDESRAYLKFPIRPGETNFIMRQINQVLYILLDFYSRNFQILPSEYYTDRTSEAVRMMRKIYRLDDKDEIDQEFYVIMMRDFSLLSKENNFL